MPWRLIRRDKAWPPAGWVFTDRRTGKKFDGMSAGFKDQVVNIIVHRMANNQKYPLSEVNAFDFEHVAMELEIETCRRLGNDKRYCQDSEHPNRRSVDVPVAGAPNCPACGHLMEPRKCSTCSGTKYKGFKCPKCYSEVNS